MNVNIKVSRQKALSFVQQGEDGKLSYWTVSASGDWSQDTNQGVAHYRALKEYIRESGDILVIRGVLPALCAVVDKTGVEIGFMDALGADVGS